MKGSDHHGLLPCLALHAFLWAGAASTASAAVSSPQVDLWDARLTVTAQQGPGCAHEPASPHVRHFIVAGIPDSKTPLLAFGDGDPIRVVPIAAGEYALEQLTPSAATAGRLRMRATQGGFAGTWQESAVDGPGCHWTTATFALVSVPPPRVERERERANLLTRAYAIAAEQAAPEAAWSVAAVTEVKALGQRLIVLGDNDLSSAQLYLDAAEALRALRRRDDATELMAMSIAMYRQLQDRWPQQTALALVSDADLLRSRRSYDLAADRYREGLALLDKVGLAWSDSAALLHGEEGTLLLRLKRYEEAARSLARAAAIDEQSTTTPPTHRSATLNNLGHALFRAGHREMARNAFKKALQGLSRDEPAHQTLIEAIESAQADLFGAAPQTDKPRLRGVGFAQGRRAPSG